MDQCSRPLKIPKEFIEYAEKNKLFDFFGAMMQSLIINKPEDPIDFLINQVDHIKMNTLRVILYGPPASGKSTLALKLHEEFNLVVITIDSLLEDANYVTREKINEYINSNMAVPLEFIAKMISDRTNQFDCRTYGWVIDGVIDNKTIFQDIQSIGVFPTHVVHLTIQEDGVLVIRAEHARNDPATGKIYNLLYNPPPENICDLEQPQRYQKEEMLKSLVQYHREKTLFEEAHKNIKKINSNQPLQDVIKDVLFYLNWQKMSPAPRVPKVILIGPTCSGKSKLADLLSKRYGLIKISVNMLIKQEIKRNTCLGELMSEYYENDSPIPAAIKIKCIIERLKERDCSIKGWIIYNFPESLSEAQLLNDSNINPDKVFFIEMTDDIIRDRKTLKRTDPISGAHYHLHTNPPESGKIAQRLVQNPKNNKSEVNRQIQYAKNNETDMRKYYMKNKIGFVVNGEQDILTMFENIDVHFHYLKS